MISSHIVMANDSLSVIKLQESNEKQKIQISLLEGKIDSILQAPKRINHSGQIEIKNSDTKKWVEYLYPSLIALSVGLIALFGTIYTGKKQRQSSENQLEIQLNQAQKTLATQIQSSIATIQLQITSEKQVAELNFRQNVLSVNRQNWINELRNIVSEIISSAELAAIKKGQKNEDFRRLNGLILKAELMVNPEKDKEFILSLKELNKSLLDIILERSEITSLSEPKTQIIALTKQTLKTEWERVKKGE